MGAVPNNAVKTNCRRIGAPGILKNLGSVRNSVDMPRQEMNDSDSESSNARKPFLPRRGAVPSDCSDSSGEYPGETVAVEVADLYKIYLASLHVNEEHP